MKLFSKEHREIAGSVDDIPFEVQFDKDGYAEVEDEAVGNYLLQLQAALLVPEATNEPKTLEKMNPAELKKYAKDNGIDVGEETKKEPLLAIINAHLADILGNGAGGQL